MKISAVVQVGRKYRAGKPEYLSGGIIRTPIYGKVQNYWGLQARTDAWYELDFVRVENGSLDDLRVAARAEIDRLNAATDTIYAVSSSQVYARCYKNTGYCPLTGAKLTTK